MSKNTIQTAGLCMCGCGYAVRSAKANYLPGHDARHKGNVAREIARTGSLRALNALPTMRLKTQAKQLAVKWQEEGKVPSRKTAGKTPQPEAKLSYRVKIGRWDYPAKKSGDAWLRNGKRDGSGDWEPVKDQQVGNIYEVEG